MQFMKKIDNELKLQCDLQYQVANQLAERFRLGRGEALEVVEAYLQASDCRLSIVKQNFDMYSKFNDWIRVKGVIATRVLGEELSDSR
jgi:hypothetical protein